MPSKTSKEPFFARLWINWMNNRSHKAYPAPDEPILRKIARRYLCSHFLLDFLSVVPPLVLTFVLHADQNGKFYIEAFHMLRIFRLNQIIIPLKMALLCCVHEKKRMKAVSEGTNMIISIIIFVHFSTCAWIYVGRVRNDPDSELPA